MRRPGRPDVGSRRRAVHLVVVLALGALVSVAVVATVLHTGSGPGPDQPPGRAVLGAATAATIDACDDALLLSVDGGGERPGSRGAGPTVDVARRAIESYAVHDGRSVHAVSLALASEPARSLVGTRPRVDRAVAAVTAPKVRRWRAPVSAGVQRALASLDRAAVDCPDQQVLLVGYAQGAAVVHRVLGVLRARTDGLVRVTGAVLVSDPERRSRSVGIRLGAPAAGAASKGVFSRFLDPVPDVPPATPTYATYGVCTAGDLVCDPGKGPLEQALRAARSYHAGPGARVVRSAAQALWRSTLLRPVPKPGVQVVSADVDVPLSLQLAVGVLPAAAAGVEWTDPLQLPPGMTLSADGLLAGTPTTYGTWNITYLVRNTDPLTTGVPGVVVLTVASESAGVSAGGQTSCETRTDGTAWCWGRNNFGQLGDGTSRPKSVPTEVAGSGGWTLLSTSGATTCGIKSTGTLWCWGLDNFGQLGIGRGKSRTTPVQVGTSAAWTSVSTSWFHTCATRANGTLWCWGSNLRGQLGNGSFTTTGAPTRVGVDSDWASVTTGGYHTCGLRRDASAWCWGQNVFGQLANANDAPQDHPVRVPGAQRWAQLSAGWAHTCGVSVQGAGWCWGLNNQGQLGDGTKTLRRVPVSVAGDRIWTTLSVGDASSCGVDNTGAAWCWGSNSYAQLGNGGRRPSVVPTLVTSEAPWLSVDAGWFHVCGAQDGSTTACWGNNELGQIGDGSVQDRAVPEEAR